MRQEIIRHLERLSRQDILATRPGSWGDFELLDVLQHFQQQRDWDRAMAVAELILRSPEHSEAIEYYEIFMELVQYYRRTDDAAALRWGHAWLAHQAQHEHGLNRFNVWRDLGEVYLGADDFDTGLAMFTRILRADPEDIWTYNILGFELPRAGLDPLAVEVLDKGLQLIARDDPHGLEDQLTRQRREVVEEQAQEQDRMDEVDPNVLADFRDALTLSAKRKTPARKVRQGPFGEIEMPPYLAPIDRLLSLGPGRDDAVYTEILAQGKVLIPELISLAFDPELHGKPADDVAHHAPAHAVALLRALRGEAELDGLSQWLDNADGDWYTELLTNRCGKVGGYTTDQLEALVADTTYDVMIRTAATDALAERANKVPAQRDRIVKLMRHLLNRPEAYEGDDEELFVGFLISDILDMGAHELYPDIKRAYDEDRVDTKVVELEDVHREWGLEQIPRTKRRSDGLYIRLRCKECGRIREHFVQRVLVDTYTLNRTAKGEEVPYDPYVMDREITCPKCGAVDRYEMTPEGHLTLIGPKGIPAIMESMLGGEPPTDLPFNPRVHHVPMQAFGRPMHPLAALDEYRRRIARKPRDAKLHLKMGNLLRTLGRRSDALDKYRQAYDLDSDDAQAALTLAMCAHDLGDRKTAQAMYERVLELSSEQPGWFRRVVRRDQGDLASAATDGLSRLRRKQSSPWAEPWEREEETPIERESQPEPPLPSRSPRSRRRRGRRRRKRRKR